MRQKRDGNTERVRGKLHPRFPFVTRMSRSSSLLREFCPGQWTAGSEVVSVADPNPLLFFSHGRGSLGGALNISYDGSGGAEDKRVVCLLTTRPHFRLSSKTDVPPESWAGSPTLYSRRAINSSWSYLRAIKSTRVCDRGLVLFTANIEDIIRHSKILC